MFYSMIPLTLKERAKVECIFAWLYMLLHWVDFKWGWASVIGIKKGIEIPKKKKKNGIAEIWKFAGIWKMLQKFAFFFFFARFGQFLYCSDRVQVAQVLEMQTHQCRVLRTETYRQPTGPLVQVGIGLTSGSLAGLSGSSQV